MISSFKLNNGIKVITQAREALSPDGADKVMEKYTQLVFPNGKKADNMLDAYIACTGAKVEDYAPQNLLNYFA